MALFSRVTTWVSNQVLTSSALNGEFNNILNNAQASSWVGYSANVTQMQAQTNPGGVGTESLAAAISDELQRLRFMQAYTLGTANWYDQTGRNLGAGNLAVLAGDIAANAVTTAKILDSNVTLAKLSQNRSASAGTNVTTSNTSGSPATIQTVNITTTGNPVRVYFTTGGTGQTQMGLAINSGGATNVYGTILLQCDGATIGNWRFGGFVSNVAPEPSTFISSVEMTHISPSVGAHTYAYLAYVSAGTVTFNIQNLVMVAEEIR